MIDTQNQYTFMIILGVIIFLTPLLKAVFDRIGISVLVGYLALGFTLRLVDQSWPIFTPFAQDGFALLANVGIVLLLFRVGLRSSLDGLIAKLPRASFIWIGDVFVSSTPTAMRERRESGPDSTLQRHACNVFDGGDQRGGPEIGGDGRI